MAKELSEMSLEELWQLFPIILKEHNPDYFSWFEIEKKKLTKCVNPIYMKRLNHIGSSAVPGLLAKPTVDILLEIDPDSNVAEVKASILKDGWGLMNENYDGELNLDFCKGYTKYGFAEKVYHLHVKYLSDWDELYFRDYLIDNEEVAKAYVDLKMSLSIPFKNNRDGYTEAKGAFIVKYSKEARALYGDKYKNL